MSDTRNDWVLSKLFLRLEWVPEDVCVSGRAGFSTRLSQVWLMGIEGK